MVLTTDEQGGGRNQENSSCEQLGNKDGQDTMVKEVPCESNKGLHSRSYYYWGLAGELAMG